MMIGRAAIVRGHAMLGLLVPLSAYAQAVRLVRVEVPNASHPAAWTNVTRVRELSNGKVLVLDARDQSVKLVDFQAGTAKLVGRKGNGPGEYVMPTGLLALPGDTTVLFDEANSGRPSIIGPAAVFTGDVLRLRADGPPIVNAFAFTDERGRIYRGGSVAGAMGFPVERWSRTPLKTDTIAYYHSREGCGAKAKESSAGGSRGNMARRGPSAAFVATDDWAVAPDGRVAVVCPNPYAARLFANGKTITGRLIPYDPVPVTDAEKQEWRDAHSGPVATLRFSNDGKMTAGYEQHRIAEPAEWPLTLPPFVREPEFHRSLYFAPDGNLWIARANAAGTGSLYDVIGPDANLRLRVLLPRRSRLVGFGRTAMYVVQRDDDDIEHFQRYAIPR